MEDPFREAGFGPGDQLIETLGWTGTTIPRRALHLARLARSAAALGLPLDIDAASDRLAAVGGPAPLRLRLTLAQDGTLALTTAPLGPSPAQWRVRLAPTRLDAADPLRGHKTTRRALYDRDRAALPQGIDELLYANAAGELVEGTITTLVFDLGHGPCTPPLAAGCLPGCLRAEALASGQWREAPLRLEELPRARLWCGNSLRGLIPATLA